MATLIGGLNTRVLPTVRPACVREAIEHPRKAKMLKGSECDRRQLMSWLAAAGLLAGTRGVQAQTNRLVVPTYGGRYERFWREVLIPPFQQKTGIQTVLDIGLGANFAT